MTTILRESGSHVLDAARDDARMEIPAWQLLVVFGERRASVSQECGGWSALDGRRAAYGPSLDDALRHLLAHRERREPRQP